MLCKKLSIFMVCAALLLTSCATTSRDLVVDSQHGAKLGWIVNFYIPETSAINLLNCLSTLTKQELDSRHFVTVKYHHVRQMYYTIAELPATMPAKIDDEVEFWPGDCSRGKISRISRTATSESE